MDRELIEHFAAGGEKLSMAIRGLTREDMLIVPDPNAGVGEWTIQQVVIHLQDSDRIAVDRMQRIIAEDNPTLIGYDESKAVLALQMDEQSIEDAITLFDVGRRQFSRVLRKLPDAAFARSGTHNERGLVSLGGLVIGYIEHLDHHLKFIHEKRARMGKEMW